VCSSDLFMRKGLVVLQFTASTAFIISTVIIYQQVQHLKNRDIGYNKNNLLVIPSQAEMGKNFNAIKKDLFDAGVIENAALANHETIDGGQNNDDYTWKGKDVNTKVLISDRGVSPGLLETCGMKIIQGRGFNANPATDISNIVITESLAKMMKTPDVLGEIITKGGRQYQVIGVVQDFLYGNMFDSKSDPLIFFCTPHYEDDNVLYLRLKPQTNPEQALARIDAVLKRYNPSYPFSYQFVDDEFNQVFISEMLVSRLSRIFAMLAIVISCLGLLGLTIFTTEQRRKEIGVRKVIGASVTDIVIMLSKDVLKLVIFSALIATPVAWLAMNNWLQNFPYRITISWWIFPLAELVALAIALGTMSWQAIKAALANPIMSLRSE
jgi:putative ABC transport system permease protein